MKLKYWVIAVTLLFTLAVGFFAHLHTRDTAEALLDTLERVRFASVDGDQSDASAQADALLRDWHRQQALLQTFLPHRDTDAVELALMRLAAVIGIGDAHGIAREIAEAKNAISNLTARESPSVHNIL